MPQASAFPHVWDSSTRLLDELPGFREGDFRSARFQAYSRVLRLSTSEPLVVLTVAGEQLDT